MSARAVRSAKKRRRELLEELEKIDQFLDLFEEFSQQAKAEKKASDGDSSSGGGNLLPAVEKEKAAKPAEIADEAQKILNSASKPMSRSELRDALVAAGLTIDATNEAKYVGTIMWRNKDTFIQIEGQGYWLKGRAFLPYYDPENEDSSDDELPGKSEGERELATLH